MNTLESYNIKSPFGDVEECAKFTIDEVSVPFTLHYITNVGQQYTLAFWVKSDTEGSMTINKDSFSTSANWAKHVQVYTATGTNLDFNFTTAGVYYIYHPKLEIGNKATDWTEAPEDVDDDVSTAQETANDASESASENKEKIAYAEALIAKLEDAIAMLVTDGDGGSLMTQTADGGWTFSMAETNDALFSISEMLSNMTTDLGDTNAVVERLDSAVTDLGELASYVKIDKSGDQPLIELGTSDGEFRLLITNTDIRFTQGSSVPAYISNKALHITKAVIEEELQLGGFVIKKRSNGNLGFLWKGVTE